MQVSIETIASEAGLTYDGLKKGFVNESLAMRYILPLCKSLSVTPNEIFGIDSMPEDINFGNMNKNGKKQILNVGSNEDLKHTIEILREQLAKKDEQIAKLLEKL